MRDHTLETRGRATDATSPQSNNDLAAWYREARARTRSIFEIPLPEAYYDRPIPLRNPIVFYDGHLPAFAINTLVKLARQSPGIDAHLESLFERGIDPEDETAVRDPAEMWPSRAEVRAYAEEADRRIEEALLDLSADPIQREAAQAIIEHESMHQETLLYMLHNLPYERKVKRQPLSQAHTGARASAGPATVRVPEGTARLGAEAGTFGWDNEFPEHLVRVGSFAMDRFNVTNGDYLAFMQATGAPAPHYWSRQDGQWFWRGMFELIPLPLDWPVYATQDEATLYAEWRESRLPTEAEYHRAAFGTPSGDERRYPWGNREPDASSGNFDFVSWDPRPVGSHPAGASAWDIHDLVGNGWEWTSTVFAGFPGFRPMAVYERYSADFFDEQHYVMKGASPATCRDLVRRSFRNWFRPNYPFVYATFRCVR